MITPIIIIDGMGGGIGVELVTRLKKDFGNTIHIIALGTNAVATDRMMQAKANKGASGDNAIKVSVNSGDFIIGPIGIVLPNGLMGEITKEIAEAVMNARGKKILIPVNHADCKIIGLKNETLDKLIDDAIQELKDNLRIS